jgi:hypothetical protein
MRFMLALVMIAAICCGICMEWRRQTIRQRKAIAALQSYGASIAYEFELQVYENTDDFAVRDPPTPGKSPWPQFLTNWVGIDALSAVGAVWIVVQDGQASPLAHLKELPALKRLTVSVFTRDSPFGVAAFNATFTSEMIAQIAECKSVECLTLTGGLPSDLEPIAAMPNLLAIDLADSNIDDESLYKMLPSQIRTLRLQGSTALSDNALRYISKRASLRALQIVADNITDKGMECITEQTQLEELFLDLPQISDTTLCYIAKLDKLRKFTLLNHRISDDGISELASLPKLAELVLSASRRFYDGVRPSETGPYLNVTVTSLCKLSKVRDLSLLDIEMGRDQVARLRCLANLKSLVIDSPLLEENDWRELRKALAPATVSPSVVFFKEQKNSQPSGAKNRLLNESGLKSAAGRER